MSALKTIFATLIWSLVVTSAWAQSPPTPPGSEGGEVKPDDVPRLVEVPKAIKLVPVDVPPGTKFPKKEVIVVLKIEVDGKGAVISVDVVDGPGDPFNASALRAAKLFRFSPGKLNTGETVPVTITFRLRIQEPPPPPPSPVRFTGVLLERGTRKPLAGVSVLAKVDGKTVARATSDLKGRFTIEVAKAKFKLLVIPIRHERAEIKVDAKPGEERTERLYLESKSSAFTTVVRASKIRREVTRRVITREEVLQIAGTQGDTIRVLENLPGVSRRPFGGGQLILRGSNPGDSKVYVEGHEIPLIYHFGGLRSSFNSGLLDVLEFVPGNFSADYGRAIGGVVDVRVRDPAKDMFRGDVDINIYDAGFILEGPINKNWSMAGAFHRSYIDVLLPLFIPDEAPISFDTLPFYYDYQFHATRDAGKGSKFNILFYGSLDRLEFLFEETGKDPKIRGGFNFRVMFHNLHLGYESRLSKKIRQETSLRAGLTEIYAIIGPELFFDLDVYSLSLRHNWSFELAESLTLRSGLDAKLDGIVIGLNLPRAPTEGDERVGLALLETNLIERRLVDMQPAIFLDLKWSPIRRLDVVPSIRADYYSQANDYTIDPRITGRYELGDSWAVKAGFGYYSQPTDPRYTDPNYGNDELVAARSIQTSFGVEKSWGDQLTVDLVGFYKDIEKLVVSNPGSDLSEDVQPYSNAGTGTIYGAEVLLKANFGDRFNGWIAYTYQKSLRRDGPDEAERFFDFDQPHLLTILGTSKIGRGWSISLRYRLISGRPETPITGSIYDAVSDTYIRLYGDDNSERLATFHQLDARIDKVWTFDTWKLNLYLDVQNVTNQGNQESWEYNYDYTERGPLTGLPVLPLLGLRGTW
jgi:TonB family protein